MLECATCHQNLIFSSFLHWHGLDINISIKKKRKNKKQVIRWGRYNINSKRIKKNLNLLYNFLEIAINIIFPTLRDRIRH